jgi:DNA-binding MarR family transcriptional regulator
VSTAAEAIADRLPPSLTHWPGYLLTFIAEQATERFERAVARYGIRTKHASVLVVIAAEGPMSQRALGSRLAIDKSPMVGLLDDLERLGLAQRRRSDADRRVQAVHLTEKGERVVARVLDIADAENARTFGVLDDAERELLHDLLLRVAEASTDARG